MDKPTMTEEELTQIDMVKSELDRLGEELQSLTKTIETTVQNIRDRQNGVFTEVQIEKAAETLFKPREEGV